MIDQNAVPPVPGVETTNVLTPEQIAAAEQAKRDAEQKAAEKAAQKAQKDAEKAEAKAKKDAEKAAAKAAKEAEKLAKAAEKQAKEEAAKAAKEANKQPEQNGVRRPKVEGKCGQAWALFDELSNARGSACAIADALPVGIARGLNEGNMKTEYALWRRFNGITGRVEPLAKLQAQAEAEAAKAAAAAASAVPNPPAAQ